MGKWNAWVALGLVVTMAGMAWEGGASLAGAGVAPATQKAVQLPLMAMVKSFPAGDQRMVAVSPKGDLLAVVEKDKVSVLDWGADKTVWSNRTNGEAVVKIRFSPGGKYLLTAERVDREFVVRCVNAADGKEVKSWLVGGIGIADMAMSPDETQVLVARDHEGYGPPLNSGALMLGMKDADPREVTDEQLERAYASHVAWLPDSKHFLINGNTIGETANARVSTPAQKRGGEWKAWSVISGNGAVIVVANTHGLTAYTVKEHKELWQAKVEYGFSAGDAGGGAFVGDDMIVTWCVEVRLWDARTGEEISWGAQRPERQGANGIETLKSASFGGKIVAGIDGKGLKIWALPKAGDKVETGTLKGTLPLIAAAGGYQATAGDLPRMMALLARGADAKAGMGEDGKGTTALLMASTAELTRVLLEAGADANAKSNSDWGYGPLHKAVERYGPGRTFEQIDLLIEHGAKVEDTAGYQMTPLQMAAQDEKADLVKHLIAKGAYYDLFSAVRLGDLERVKVLLKEKPELVNVAHEQTKQTPLFWARSSAMIDVLLAAGAKQDVIDAWKQDAAGLLRGDRREDLAAHLDERKGK